MSKKPLVTIRWLNDNTILHIELPLGIVNIRPGLQNVDDHPVHSIEILPNEGIRIDGNINTRLVDTRPPEFD